MICCFILLRCIRKFSDSKEMYSLMTSTIHKLNKVQERDGIASAHGAMSHRIESSFSYFSQCMTTGLIHNKGSVMCYPIYGMVHIRIPCC